MSCCRDLLIQTNTIKELGVTMGLTMVHVRKNNLGLSAEQAGDPEMHS